MSIRRPPKNPDGQPSANLLYWIWRNGQPSASLLYWIWRAARPGLCSAGAAIGRVAGPQPRFAGDTKLGYKAPAKADFKALYLLSIRCSYFHSYTPPEAARDPGLRCLVTGQHGPAGPLGTRAGRAARGCGARPGRAWRDRAAELVHRSGEWQSCRPTVARSRAGVAAAGDLGDRQAGPPSPVSGLHCPPLGS